MESQENRKTSQWLKMKIGPWQISTVALGVLLVISVFIGVFAKSDTGASVGQISLDTAGQTALGLTGQEVADKTVNYINQNLLQGQATATLKGVEESNGLYNLSLSINGQEIDGYATKDGKLFFPQAINLDKTPEPSKQTQTQEMVKTETPDAKLFTMSFCPYGNQAEEAMHPVVEALKGKADVEPHYVIYSNYRGGGPQYCLDEENKYCSMHGIQELNQDVRELCTYKYQKDKYWDFVMKINEKCSAQDVDSCWEAIAVEQGIEAEKIKACQEDEAISLLEQEAGLSEKYGVRGSPTLIINDVTYQGGRTPEAYKQAICSAFTTEPGECTGTLSESAAASPAGGCG